MKFGVDAGAPMLSGVKVLADAVKINMGPKVLRGWTSFLFSLLKVDTLKF